MGMRALVFLSIFSGCLLASAAVLGGDVKIGAKTGPMLLGDSGIDSPTNAALVVGYEMGMAVADVAIEGEVSTTLAEGSDSAAVDTGGVYLAARTAGPVYFKGRGGLVGWETDVNGTTRDGSGASFGVGMGFSLGVTQIELDYTLIDNDISFLSIGAQF